jgi:hypothetical protein
VQRRLSGSEFGNVAPLTALFIEPGASVDALTMLLLASVERAFIVHNLRA